MQNLSLQLAALPGADTPVQDVSKEMLETTLARNGLKVQTLSVNDALVRAQLSSVSMVAVQSWLIELQKTASLYADEVNVTGIDGGLVNVTLLLRQSTHQDGV